jgi:hypothetical protein
MSQGVILGLAFAAGLACPLHMWWSHRRGRQAACCAPDGAADASNEIEALRARQDQLSTLVAEHERTIVAGTDRGQFSGRG